MAKDRILENGDHMPMVYCQFKGDEAINLLALPDIFCSDEGKAKRFFSVGRTLGAKNPHKDLSSLAFISEAWMSRREVDNPNFDIPPSQDPHRIEVLIVNTMDMIPEADKEEINVEQNIHVIEMIRDNEGNLLDLFHRRDDEQKNVESKLLTSFLSGFLSTKITEEKMIEIALKTAMEKGLSEEEAHEFVRTAMKDILHPCVHMLEIPDNSKTKQKPHRRK